MSVRGGGAISGSWLTLFSYFRLRVCCRVRGRLQNIYVCGCVRERESVCVGERGYFRFLSDFVPPFMSQASLQASGSATEYVCVCVCVCVSVSVRGRAGLFRGLV